ncbi:ubiquitin-specific protease ubp15 [Orobanche gracilis]
MKVPNSEWFRRQLTKGEFKTNFASAVQWDCIFAATNTDRTLFLIKQLSNDLAGRGRLIRKKETKWSRPPEDWFKLNVDGSIDTSGQSGAVGGLLRDANGNWKWGFSKLIGPTIVDEAELLAIFHGLDIAWSKRIHELVVETDSESIFKMLADDSHVTDSLHELVTRCRNLIHNPWDIEVKKVDRGCNRSADCMAKLGQGNQSGVVFWDTPPESVISAIRRDRLGL